MKISTPPLFKGEAGHQLASIGDEVRPVARLETVLREPVCQGVGAREDADALSLLEAMSCFCLDRLGFRDIGPLLHDDRGRHPKFSDPDTVASLVLQCVLEKEHLADPPVVVLVEVRDRKYIHFVTVSTEILAESLLEVDSRVVLVVAASRAEILDEDPTICEFDQAAVGVSKRVERESGGHGSLLRVQPLLRGLDVLDWKLDGS